MDIMEQSLKMHELHTGKMEIQAKVPLNNRQDLSKAYSPGVASPCVEISKNPDAVYKYTSKGNMVGVVSDGSAVLGLGDIGPEAALPVMEGKALLMKRFANVDAFPICLNTSNVDEIVNTVKLLSPSFGAFNLEDISAPRCFEIEERLRKECDVPVFHDDQHGTAIVVAAGLENALKIVGKQKDEIRIVINGAGAAGIAILKLLHRMGYSNMMMCDTKGIIYAGRRHGMNPIKHEIATLTNVKRTKGDVSEALKGADVFIGVSVADLLTKEHIESMAKDPIVFAMANPNPEITYENAKMWGVKVMGTGRSDYPNQVNNMLAFPGIFRGTLDARATDINDDMKMAAVRAIADYIDAEQLTDEYVIPDSMDEEVAKRVAKAVERAAIKSGVSKISVIK